MAVMGSPCAPAFSQSTSSRYSGTSSMPLGRTFASRGSCAAMPSNWLRAAIKASWPKPPRSCNWKSNPLAVPSSRTAGGAKAKTIASRNCENVPMAVPATAAGLQLGPVAELPVPQLHERHAHVLASAREAEAGDHHARFDGVLLIDQKMVPDLVHDLLGHVQRRIGGQDGLNHQNALVLVGQVGRGHPAEKEHEARHDQAEDDQVTNGVGQDAVDLLHIQVASSRRTCDRTSGRTDAGTTRRLRPAHALWAPA